jgi:hypothetical protein
MPLLAFHLEASSNSLLTIAWDDDSDKRPWKEGPTHSGRSPLPHRMRMTIGPAVPHRIKGRALANVGDCLCLFLSVMVIITCWVCVCVCRPSPPAGMAAMSVVVEEL